MLERVSMGQQPRSMNAFVLPWTKGVVDKAILHCRLLISLQTKPPSEA